MQICPAGMQGGVGDGNSSKQPQTISTFRAKSESGLQPETADSADVFTPEQGHTRPAQWRVVLKCLTSWQWWTSVDDLFTGDAPDNMHVLED
jgi:hypothetical protein